MTSGTREDGRNEQTDWSLGDSRVGYGVPLSVRRGGATRPTLKYETEAGVTCRENHSVTFQCDGDGCENTKRYASSSFQHFDWCEECGDYRDFNFKWGLNKPGGGESA